MNIDFSRFDQKKLITAAIIVLGFLVVVIALPLVIPIAGILVAIGIIIAAVYGIYTYFTRR